MDNGLGLCLLAFGGVLAGCVMWSWGVLVPPETTDD